MLLRIACRGCLGPFRDPGHITLPLFGWSKKDRGDTYVRIPSRPGCSTTFPPLASLVPLPNLVARFVWGPDSGSFQVAEIMYYESDCNYTTFLPPPVERTFLGSRDPRRWRGELHLLTGKQFGTLQRRIVSL